MHRPLRTAALLAGLTVAPNALAQSAPSRQVPASVLAEMRVLESRFELALAADCDSERCFSKGCTYVEHAVADQPQSASLPGLGSSKGPGSVAPQEFLTRAQCAFAHEDTVEPEDVQALTRRLQTKLSGGWTVVSVSHQELLPLPEYLRDPPEPEAAAPEAPAEAPAVSADPWRDPGAGRELWLTLLPHLFWMLGIGLVTLAASLLMWAWRRVGQPSFEERALLAELENPQPYPEPGEAPVMVEEDLEAAQVARLAEAWAARLEAAAAPDAPPDRQLQALLRERLRAGDLPLLAAAMLRFPEHLPASFPEGGDVAAAKLALADYLKTVDAASLPPDAELFSALDRYALSAALATQSDAEIVRGLREDFGAAGLAALIDALPGRTGALLFALAPRAKQAEMLPQLDARQILGMSDQLLRSDRMSRREAAHLFEVLRAARADAAPPEAPAEAISDRGAAFDAAGALSLLLSALTPDQQRALFRAALQRARGSLPAWHREVLTADTLQALPAEARADLLLEIDVDALAAWFSGLDTEARGRLLDGAPNALRASLSGASAPADPDRRLALADEGRRSLARGLQRQLARAGVTFERAVAGPVDPERE